MDGASFSQMKTNFNQRGPLLPQCNGAEPPFLRIFPGFCSLSAHKHYGGEKLWTRARSALTPLHASCSDIDESCVKIKIWSAGFFFKVNGKLDNMSGKRDGFCTRSKLDMICQVKEMASVQGVSKPINTWWTEFHTCEAQDFLLNVFSVIKNFRRMKAPEAVSK